MLVFALDLKEVEEIGTGGVNLDKVLVGRGGGSGELSNFQIERSLQPSISRSTSDFKRLVLFSSYVSEFVP